MRFAAPLAADLSLLTDALNDPDADIATSVRRFAADTTAAIPAYLGLSVVVSQHDPPFTFTILEDGGTAADIRTSIRLELRVPGTPSNLPVVAIILYAGAPGTFVDLAADLAWLTGQPPAAFALDAHLEVPDGLETSASLGGDSIINQAIGVLIDRGQTLEQAHRELEDQAVAAGTDRPSVAHLILATLHGVSAEDGGDRTDQR